MRRSGPLAERVAERRDHAHVLAVVETDLEVEDVVAGREPRGDLRAQIVVVAAREVEEVRHVVAQRAAEQAPERLADGLAADVGERHVDADQAKLPVPATNFQRPKRPGVGPHRVAVPGVATDDEAAPWP